MGFLLPRAPGCQLLASAKENCQTDRGARPHPEHCSEEVIDYFGRCVEPAAQADADPIDVDDHRLHGGQSWPIDYRLGFFSSKTCSDRHGRLSDRALDDATGMRADASRSRGNGGTRRCGSDDDNVLQEMTVRTRHGVVRI
jgi:hypothetical protein